jgi:hypothetical protein
MPSRIGAHLAWTGRQAGGGDDRAGRPAAAIGDRCLVNTDNTGDVGTVSR